MTSFPPIISRLMPSLGRESDHEVLTAVRAIGRALAAAGRDWFDIAAACAPSGPAPSASPSPPPHAFGDLARAVRDLDGGRLTLKERGFVHQMCSMGFTYRSTERQRAWLASLFDRLQRRAA